MEEGVTVADEEKKVDVSPKDEKIEEKTSRVKKKLNFEEIAPVNTLPSEAEEIIPKKENEDAVDRNSKEKNDEEPKETDSPIEETEKEDTVKVDADSADTAPENDGEEIKMGVTSNEETEKNDVSDEKQASTDAAAESDIDDGEEVDEDESSSNHVLKAGEETGESDEKVATGGDEAEGEESSLPENGASVTEDDTKTQ
eukprot:CAMPEP_0201200360 /NCGR_PEP_ID=MMETSP0851-20130426/160826_1 /ASSEMBLY_ACC=CAM_ASM_000631 /TAXON_ID=183588 /ORGANISM="Pseudo-nitzschia fraudulenta, Strain WWA7" /LENGTH=198 /DNA_ID=CAMNT_0047487923 /DNA_START=33 /DNA_END=626 /DNA_ORIENTATION=+